MANKNKIISSAQKYIAKGQWDRAIKELQKLVADDPSDVRTLLKLGDVYSKKGDRENATKVYKQVAESYSEQGFFLKAVAVYKQILKHEPKHLAVTLKLAELYEHLGLQSEAMQQYQVAASIHDDLGETKQSLEVLERMVELDTENVASRIKLAESYSREGMTDKAAEQFERAAEILKGQARIDDYIKVAERLVYHAPNRLAIVMDLAKLYLQRGDTKRGLAKLQLCFKANPRDIETLRLLAQAFNDLGQTQKTVFVYRELARIYDEAGRPEDAQGVRQMILEVDPNDAEARNALGLDGTPHPDAAPPAPTFEEPIFTPAPIEEPEVLHEAQLIDAPSLMPSSAPSFAPSLAPRPAPPSMPDVMAPDAMAPSLAPRPSMEPPARFPPTDVAVPSDDEVLILDEPEELYVDAVPTAPPARAVASPGPDRDQIGKVLTETDVYIKYGLREKALDHLRAIFDIDPDNVGAYYKMRDIYVSMGSNARAAEAIANVLHIHARRGDVDALSAAREDLRALAPGHPLVAGGLPGAIPAPLHEEDLDSIDIMEDSSEFEVDISEEGVAAFQRGVPLIDEAPDFSGFDDMPEPPDEPAALQLPPSAHSEDLIIPAPSSMSDDIPLVTNSQVVSLDEPTETPVKNVTDRHPLILSEEMADNEAPWEGGDEGVTQAALPEDLEALSLASPVGLRERVEPEFTDEPSTDASLLPDDDDDELYLDDPPEAEEATPKAEEAASEVDEDLEDELDEAEFLLQTELYSEAREAIQAVLNKSPGYARAEEMLASIPADDDDDVEDETLDRLDASPIDIADDDIDDVTGGGPFDASDDEPADAFAAGGDIGGDELDDAFGALSAGSADDETTAEDHYDQGMAFKELGRTDDAIREFEGALGSERRRITSLEMIGLCFMDKNEPERAIDYFTMAMDAGAEGPARVNLKYEIGAAHAEAGALDEAVQWFYDCARDDPDHRGVGDRLREMGVSLSTDIPSNGVYTSDGPEDDPAPKKNKISYL
ncbi:MAG: tetratricopeptide repeat protein [Deltaproteobacteria bacterium]